MSILLFSEVERGYNAIKLLFLKVQNKKALDYRVEEGTKFLLYFHRPFVSPLLVFVSRHMSAFWDR